MQTCRWEVELERPDYGASQTQHSLALIAPAAPAPQSCSRTAISVLSRARKVTLPRAPQDASAAALRTHLGRYRSAPKRPKCIRLSKRHEHPQALVPRPNVRAKLPAEAGAVSPVRDNSTTGAGRAYSACRSGSA